jgi:type II secretory ATPase GspE/PulE/Tfp pilus assembly ATPase PilB-like protein
MRASTGYIDIGEQTWSPEDPLVSFVAIFGDGRALVARDQAQDVNVRTVLRIAEQHLGLQLRREYVRLEDIAQARKDGLAGRRGSGEAQMQLKILDLIEKAQEVGASDIHIDVAEQITTVSLRVDGTLFKHDSWTKDFGLRFLGACYAMADIANKSYSPARFLAARLAPRDGRDKWAFPHGLEAVRMQFSPKTFGVTYAVLRLLGSVKATSSIEDLGFEPEQLHALKAFARRNKGLAIIAGPTGSGKSTTMATLLIRQREIDEATGRARTCFTIEDPPERRLPGAQQLVVPNTDTDEARAAAFADSIRAALRSDPDVVMIGEIRDLITANLAVTASMTGHQVWSTLHCSTAHAIPLRLADLGVDRTVILGSDELQVAVGQVLVPKLCTRCSRPLMGEPPSPEVHALAAMLGHHARVPSPQGCDACRQTGFRGRTVLAEVVRTDPDYLKVLAEEGIVAARAFSRARGEPSIDDIAKRKATRGEISAFTIPELMEVEARPDTAPLPLMRAAS